jgi:transcriptional regulator with XRE-family HTH domain
MQVIARDPDIERLLQEEGLKQGELAKRLEIDQSSVSRALNMLTKPTAPAHARICAYMQERRLSASPLDVVSEVWDGSEEHARALSELIRASQGLWPGPGEKEQKT